MLAQGSDLLAIAGPIAAVTSMLVALVTLFVRNMGKSDTRVDKSTALLIAQYEVQLQRLLDDREEADGRWESERAEKQEAIVRYERVLESRDRLIEQRDREIVELRRMVAERDEQIRALS